MGSHSASVAMHPAEPAVPHVLVADDNPVSLRFFADALAQLGLSCALANDGREAVAQAQHASFDLLLLDARMPGLDGAQALAQIRGGSGPSRDVVALATSADASAAALRDRLHRLDASAGFCGAPGLARAGAQLRLALETQSGWPHAAAADFLAVCAEVRALLVRPGVGGTTTG